MPLPLKPGESPEEIAPRLWHVLTGGRAAGPEIPVIVAYLKAYGDRRGEEERAKALEAAAKEYDAPGLSDIKVYCRHVAQRLRSLAAAPSGDAKGTK